MAFEFRHATWFDDEVSECLKKHQCALCVVDSDEDEETQLAATAPWSYIRLRRDEYTEADLIAWRERLEALECEEAYVFFKHEQLGPQWAQQLHAMACS